MCPQQCQTTSVILQKCCRSDRTFKECLKKKLFATKDPKDISNIDGRTAVFLWNCFQRELHGVWVSIKEGNLDSRAFGGKFKHQVCPFEADFAESSIARLHVMLASILKAAKQTDLLNQEQAYIAVIFQLLLPSM